MKGDASAKKPNYAMWAGGCGCGCLTIIALAVSGFFVVKSFTTVTQVTYNSSKEGLTGARAEHFVDFTFKYPSSWNLTSNAPNSPNFVDLRLGKNNVVVENFVIGTYVDKSPAGNYAVTASLLDDILKQSPNVQKIGEREVKIGEYTGYEVLGEGKVTNGAQGINLIRQKIVAVRNPNGGNGVLFLMIATNLNEAKSTEDLDKVSDMKVMIDSFRFK
jgi:hypothetical protein